LDGLFKNFLFPFEFFLTLGTARPNFVESLKVTLSGASDEIIEVFFAQENYATNTDVRLINSDMLFNLADCLPGIEERY
ncbi:MAG: hypothetical protein H0X08_09790, partial [Blastocatellia bacterium]|nr:hypothetical protein [Blastocatellia bacterium]